MMTNVIPLWFFKVYWLCWFLLSLAAVVLDSGYLVVPLVIAFITVETLGILFTVKNEGTLTDTDGEIRSRGFDLHFYGSDVLAPLAMGSGLEVVWSSGLDVGCVGPRRLAASTFHRALSAEGKDRMGFASKGPLVVLISKKHFVPLH